MMTVSDMSLRSQDSFLSIASRGSILSIGSAGSVLSIGSVGSALSIGQRRIDAVGLLGRVGLSVGSALSAASRWSLLSSGGDRDVLARRCVPAIFWLLAVAGATAALATMAARRDVQA